ncbi:hypothetical protein AAFN86_23355 [Roseomonas sp. CAU 1739]|uniref:hypothetical protein n=1 Tax=Roseomonas sp. CAU 1739 TaxID=3140364 RepID=UPI00325C1E9E
MTVILSHRRAGHSVDVAWRGANPTSTLAYRLVEATPEALLCLRLSDNPALLPNNDAHAAPRGEGADIVILRLSELARALPGLLPQQDRRSAFIAALRDSLDDWPPLGQATPASRLRAACAEAVARLPDQAAAKPARRKATTAKSATRADEESQEALFRALYFCRQRADGDA